jgi:deoxycytidylate deaminase
MDSREEKPKRIPWDEYWMNIVEDVAKRSTCLRRQIGALVVKNNVIVSTGYNGAPRGFPHCLEAGCRRDKLNIASGERHEECLPPEVDVVTDAGYKSLSQVSTNDRVLTHESRFMPVVRTMSRDYHGELSVIQPEGLLPIRLTPEHPVLAVPTVTCEKEERTVCKETCQRVNKNNCRRPYEHYKAQWIPACDVEKGDLLVLPFDTGIEDRVALDVALNRDSLHLFGLYLAAGSSSSGNHVTFTFNKAEEDVIEEVKDSMNAIFGLAVYKGENKSEGIRLVFSSKTVAELFITLFGNGALDKKMPGELMRLLPGKQKYLLDGWVKGDGYRDNVHDSVSASTVSRTLALQMLQLSLRLGRTPVIDYSPAHYKHRKSAGYRLVWDERSQARYIKGNKLFSPVLETGREGYKGKVYNVEVEQDESYNTPSFDVHNCIGIHAEQNALLQAGRDAECATLYVNAFPCKICAKLIINAGIKRVVMSGEYSDKEGLEYLGMAGVELVYL